MDLIVAHGWYLDDVGWFLGPLVLVFVWLKVSERRARRRLEDQADDRDPAESPPARSD